MSELKIAILGNYSLQFLHRSLKKACSHFTDVTFYEADFNSTDQEILNPHSSLYSFAPDYIVWHESALGLRDRFYTLDATEKTNFAKDLIGRLGGLLQTLQKHLPGAVVFFPIPAPAPDGVFGNLFSKVPHSWQYQASHLNWLLTALSDRTTNLYLIDNFAAGDTVVTDWQQVVAASLHFTPDYLDSLAAAITRFIGAFQGQAKKCLVMDLDNVLWGGVVAEDGLEGIALGPNGTGSAYTRLQHWIRQLAQRGIILAVCSKNDEEMAMLPFQRHPEMILALEDIAVFIANWNSKADNIDRMREVLNIGFDSMVFLDDSPVEREIIRRFIPGICVPELPPDPSEYLPYLISLNLFETASYSANDAARTQQYREEASRVAHRDSITSMDDFLASLQMVATLGPFIPDDYDRIAQLSQRSNQFNLCSARYTADHVRLMAEDPARYALAIRLRDKFGSYGLTGIITATLHDHEATLDNWLMSCRVLKRDVEQLMLNTMVHDLHAKGVRLLHASYTRTAKNSMVAGLLPSMGFTPAHSANQYTLNLHDYNPATIHITIE